MCNTPRLFLSKNQTENWDRNVSGKAIFCLVIDFQNNCQLSELNLGAWLSTYFLVLKLLKTVRLLEPQNGVLFEGFELEAVIMTVYRFRIQVESKEGYSLS